MVLGDMGGIELGENLDFLLNVLNLILCAFEINDLNSDRLLGTLVVAVTEIRRVNMR